MITMDVDKVCFVIMKMRELEEEDVIAAQYEEEDAGDALHLSEPEEREEGLSSEQGYDEEEEGFDEEEDAEGEEIARRDPYEEELSTFISNLSDEEQIELTALAWMGRGDFGAGDWKEGLQTARERHNDRTAAYLMGLPLLPDYLAEGLAAFNMSCDEFDESRM